MCIKWQVHTEWYQENQATGYQESKKVPSILQGSVATWILNEQLTTDLLISATVKNYNKSQLHRQTHMTCCITPIMLYTNVDAQCDKLATDDRRHFITLGVYLSWQHLRQLTCSCKVLDNVPEGSTYPYFWRYPNSLPKQCGISLIHSAISIQYRLVTDIRTQSHS